MTDAMQTIRECLEDIKRTPHHPDYDTYTHGTVCTALTALDSLAGEPSEEFVPMLHGKSEIESHDERILKEKLEKINHVIEIRGYDSLGWPMITDDEIKSILTPEAT